MAFDLLIGTDSEWSEGNLSLVKSMHMFIQQTPAAIFACHISMSECNIILSAYTEYRHLG